MTASQCTQAEYALYWLLWRHGRWFCTGIGYSCATVLHRSDESRLLLLTLWEELVISASSALRPRLGLDFDILISTFRANLNMPTLEIFL
jgi:hypothetical protein